MENQLVQVNQSQLPVNRMVPTDHEMMVYHTIAKQASSSKMYKGIGDESSIMVIMLAARELGIPPMQSLNGGIHIIQGKVEISARMMTALIRRAGHSLQIKKSDDKECVVVGKRCDNGDTITAKYTIEDAKQAGLVKAGSNWTKVPTDMLFARAVSRLSRQLFSDIIGIGYVEGEIPRNAEYEIVTHEEEEVPLPPDEEKAVREFLERFDDEAVKIQWTAYITTVSEHFKWTKAETVDNFSKDFQETEEKFKKWLSKKK